MGLLTCAAVILGQIESIARNFEIYSKLGRLRSAWQLAVVLQLATSEQVYDT